MAAFIVKENLMSLRDDASQLQAFRDALIAETDPVIVQALIDGTNNVIADWYNTLTVGFFVWRTAIRIEEIDEVIDWSEVVGSMSTNALLSFQVLKSGNSAGVNASKSSIRQAFNELFKPQGNQQPNSNAALAALAKRLANRVEELLATGTGTEANPATMTFEGSIDRLDVAAALAL